MVREPEPSLLTTRSKSWSGSSDLRSFAAAPSKSVLLSNRRSSDIHEPAAVKSVTAPLAPLVTGGRELGRRRLTRLLPLACLPAKRHAVEPVVVEIHRGLAPSAPASAFRQALDRAVSGSLGETPPPVHESSQRPRALVHPMVSVLASYYRGHCPSPQ